MAEEIDPAFRFRSLEKYSFWERLAIRAGGFLYYLFVRSICSTIKFESIGPEPVYEPSNKTKHDILAFWHDRIIPSTYYFRNRRIIVLSSHSYDSEITARCIQRFGFGIVKGSSSRGAVSGMVGLIRMMKRGFPVGFTVDGPRGPRYEAKAGPILLAKKTGSPILPFIIECKGYWTIRSWDKLQIPKPFTTAVVTYAERIYVDTNANENELQAKRLELQQALDTLVKQSTWWRTVIETK